MKTDLRSLELVATEMTHIFGQLLQTESLRKAIQVKLDETHLDFDQLTKFLQKVHVYAYPKADHTCDAVIYGYEPSRLGYNVLLIKRGRPDEPFYGCWALPGGFMDPGENLDVTVAREMQEETGLTGPSNISGGVIVPLTQFGTFSDPERDPRGRVISTAYVAQVLMSRMTPKAADDAVDIGWFPFENLPPLAFDHEKIIMTSMQHLQRLGGS